MGGEIFADPYPYPAFFPVPPSGRRISGEKSRPALGNISGDHHYFQMAIETAIIFASVKLISPR